MKKHFKLLLVALVVVLCCSTVVLAACNKNKPPKEEPNYDAKVSTIINQIVEKVGSSLTFGETFSADVDIDFGIDDQLKDENDVTFKINFKGNANGAQNAQEGDTNFVFDFVQVKGEEETSLFSLAYEAINNQPYFFASIGGSDYRKINGYSLTSLLKLANKDEAAPSADGGSLVDTIVSVAAPILFGENGTIKDNVYTLNFDLGYTVSQIMGMKSVILPAVGLSEEQVNAVIEQYLGFLTYKQGTKTVAVKDLTTLEAFFKRGMSLKGTIAFAFDANNKFNRADIDFDFNYHKDQEDEIKQAYSLNVNKAVIGPRESAIDTFDGFALNADERANAQAINLVNFSLQGTATGYNASGNVAHRYIIDVQADINPLALLDLINGTDKANVVATLKKLGYFHLSIDEVNEEGNITSNIITLHSKFEEGFAVAQVNAYKAVLYNVGLGGVYDFDTLVDVIGKIAGGEGAAAADFDINAIVDTVKSVVNTVKTYLDTYFTIDDIANNGVTVELHDLVFDLLDQLGIDSSDSMTALGINAILGNETMNVKLQTPTYGTCQEVATDTLKAEIRATSSLSAGKNDFIKEIVSLNGFDGKVLQYDATFAKYAENVVLGKAFAMTGINLKGETVATSGLIVACDGLDVTKPGSQEVTLYIGIANDMLDFARAGFSFPDIYPLYGTLKFKTTIEVVAYDENAEVTVSNFKTADQNTTVNNGEAFKLVASTSSVMSIGTLANIAVDSSMLHVYDAVTGGNDVTATALNDSGKFAQVGTYYVAIEFAHYTSSRTKIVVTDAYAKRVDGQAEQESITLGGTWNFGEYEVYAVKADGTEEKQNIAVQYRIGYTTYTLDQIFDIDNDVYTLKKNLNWVGENFTIRFANVNLENGQRKTVDVNIPIVADYAVTDKFSTTYFGQTCNGEMQLTVNDVVYSVVLKNGAWVAVAEDGTEQAIELSFTWRTRKIAVVFDENGFITNFANQNKAGSRSEYIDYVLTVDGHTYTGNFTAYELYASNWTSAKVGNTLDGRLGASSYLTSVVEGEVKALEFKYGTEGYGFYVKGTDTKVVDVNVTVEKGGEAYTLTDGAFTETGSYTVHYSLTFNGVEQTFFHTVTVK